MPLQLRACQQQQAAQRASLLQRLRGRLRAAGRWPLLLLLISFLGGKWQRCWHVCGQLLEHHRCLRITWRR
jgi:hypothetical protein